MAVREHQLFNELLENVMVWVWPEIEERIKREGYQVILGLNPNQQFSPKQRYEYGSYYWCKQLTNVFDRLKDIRNMTLNTLFIGKRMKRRAYCCKSGLHITTSTTQ